MSKDTILNETSLFEFQFLGAPFFENLITVVSTLPQYFLLFIGQLNNIFTFIATAILHLQCTSFTLNK